MWDADEFIAKAQMYFENADSVPVSPEDPVGYQDALWLLLGLEFLLRAPLARVHPTLLAVPEGTSILHAAGYSRPGGSPRSIPTKTVVERFSHIEPEFNEDHKRKAMFLADLRNGELHTSAAVLDDLKSESWLPQFLDVVESLVNHLNVFIDDLLPTSVIERAIAARAKIDRALSATIKKRVHDASLFYSNLTPGEVTARLAARTPLAPGQIVREIDCPACKSRSATVQCAPSRSDAGVYDEENGTISYRVTHLAESLACRVCGLSLENTAAIVAAGVPRLFIDEFEEDRYEGWEEAVSHSDMIDRLGIGEPELEYGND